MKKIQSNIFYKLFLFICYIDFFRNEKNNNNSKATSNTNILNQRNSLTVMKNYVSSNFLESFDLIDNNDIPISEFSESYFTNIVNKFLNSLYLEQEVSVDSIGKIINFINYDYYQKIGKNSMASTNNFSKQFIDGVLSEKKTLYIHFKNLQNLKHFANILNTITINIDNMNCENYDLNFAIIYIAGRTFYRRVKPHDNNLAPLILPKETTSPEEYKDLLRESISENNNLIRNNITPEKQSNTSNKISPITSEAVSTGVILQEDKPIQHPRSSLDLQTEKFDSCPQSLLFGKIESNKTEKKEGRVSDISDLNGGKTSTINEDKGHVQTNNDNLDLKNQATTSKNDEIYEIQKEILESKVYLSALLSKNKLYSSKSFWMDLIELKIARKVEEAVKKSNINNNNTQSNIPKRKEKESFNSNINAESSFISNNNYSITTLNTSSINNINYFTQNYNNNNSNSSGIISSMGSRIKGLFKGGKSGKNNQSNNNTTTPNSNSQTSKEQTQILNRDNLMDNYSNVSETVKYMEASSVLKEFISHFANFNLEITDAMNIIVEIASKYNFPKERISLFVTILNSNCFTVKNILPKTMKGEIPKKQKLENEIITTSIMDKKLEAIFRAYQYIPKAELFKVFLLNREALIYLNKRIYSIKLGGLEPTETKNRLSIWKTVLKVVNFNSFI